MAVQWRELTYDEQHPDIDPVALWEAGGRSGPLLGEVFSFVLAPRWELTF
jgi:hypothetical protein